MGLRHYLVLDFHRIPLQNYENNTNSKRWIWYADRHQTATAMPSFRYKNVTGSSIEVSLDVMFEES
jgi:hypothetical protein